MTDPSRIAVSPSLLADVGRQLAALYGALDRAGAHLRGPRPAPPVGDDACGLAYQAATHQLAGLVTSATERERSFTRSLTAAATLYALLDGSAGPGTMTWLGPPPLALALPAELAEADPAGMRRRAAEHRDDAGAAAQQARALRSAVVRLIPAAWLGLGSLSFARVALLQAATLEEIGQACSDLATALDALAVRLEQARGEAIASVQAGRRLDEEVAADNAAWERRPEPERPDPDPATLATQDSVARLLVARLLDATEAARQAWSQARAAFDLVGYRMPALSARMTAGDEDWRPSSNLVALPTADRQRLLGTLPICVDGGWGGSGALIGPDGRSYPLVVPWVEQHGVRWTADEVGSSTETLDGADPGWHQIGTRLGVDAFGPAATTATKAAIATAAFLGNAPQMIGRLRPDLLPRLRWTSTGVPLLQAPPDIPSPRAGSTASVPRSALVRDDDGLRWVANTSTDRTTSSREVTRQNPTLSTDTVTPAVPNVVGLTDSGLAGLGTVRRLDDGRLAAYRATFEENDDGRIRARLTLYQVRTDGSATTVLSRDAAVGSDGSVSTSEVRWRPPAGPVMTAVPSTG